tara:strand:- start:59 stop:607 length:549 start_codon:yes stop_codon:yes gene_type:complete
MAHFFNNNDDDEELRTKINIDELYESKQKSDFAKLNTYKKVLNRIHTKIKTTTRMARNMQHCWYTIPEVLLGAPHYDQPECIRYVIEQLEDNGFITRYNHPNVLFISWNHWVPNHVRNEIKKKTGVEIDGYGNVVKHKYDNAVNNNNNIEEVKKPIKTKDYKDISTYKPTGKFSIYDDIFKN